MTVEKRDGTIVEYNEVCIVKAVNAAARAVKEVVEDAVLEKIVKYVTNKVSKLDEPIKIDDIQNSVEEALMKYNLYKIEIAFHDYRKERDRVRFEGMPIIKEYNDKLSGAHYDRQNANVDGQTFGGMIGEATNSIMKYKALNYMINPKYAKLHTSWKNYIHDLDKWAVGMHNCLSYPIDNITAMAATIKLPKALRVPGGIESLLQVELVHLQSQSQDQFGGVSLTHFDWTAVPYIRKSFYKFFNDAILDYSDFTGKKLEDLPFTKYYASKVSIEDGSYKSYPESVYKAALRKLIRATHQACESFLHNANTLQSRSGNQLPFTSVNYGTCTLPEGRIIIGALLDAWEEGIGELHLTPIFPCGIFQLIDGINTKEGDPNYDLFEKAISVLPKRVYPNFANGDWSVDRAGFKKSQDIKYKVLSSLDANTISRVAELEYETEEALGFHIKHEDGHYTIQMNDYPQPFEMMSTMGCRTYNGFDINFTEDYFLNKVLLPTLENHDKKFKEAASILETQDKAAIEKIMTRPVLPLDQLWSGNQKDGRGNIAPNTVVMPFYAMEAIKKATKAEHPEYAVDYFMDMLEVAIGNSKDELIDRFNWIAAQSPAASKYMYIWNHTMLGWDETEGIRSCLKHGTLAIGQLGMAETLQILIGEDQTTKRGMEVATHIEELFNRKCAEYKDHYKLNFGVYYTPAENLCHTAFKAFKKKYKDIENVTYFMENGKRVEKKFFTNSIHVPVYYDTDIFEKFTVESKLAKFSNAGCITYGEIDDDVKFNLDAIKQYVLFAKGLDLPYIALNFQINECTICGSTDIDTETKTCRCCGATDDFINWLRRITGYLNGNYKTSFNDGKQNETELRKPHTDYQMQFIKIK